MNRIALTGGIGSGKSVVCRVFSLLGIAIYDSDSRAKRLMAESEDVRKRLCAEFGDDIYVDGILNRAALAARVFCDKAALSRLNAIVHPAVLHDFDCWAEERAAQGDRYVIMESAILFENNLDKGFEYTVAVDSPLEIRLERSMRRDRATREQILARMANQLPQEEVNSRADYVIYKDGDKMVWEQVLALDKVFEA